MSKTELINKKHRMFGIHLACKLGRYHNVDKDKVDKAIYDHLVKGIPATKASKSNGISRATFYRYMKHYSLLKGDVSNG